jgi:hypothetical protein
VLERVAEASSVFTRIVSPVLASKGAGGRLQTVMLNKLLLTTVLSPKAARLVMAAIHAADPEVSAPRFR